MTETLLAARGLKDTAADAEPGRLQRLHNLLLAKAGDTGMPVDKRPGLRQPLQHPGVVNAYADIAQDRMQSPPLAIGLGQHLRHACRRHPRLAAEAGMVMHLEGHPEGCPYPVRHHAARSLKPLRARGGQPDAFRRQVGGIAQHVAQHVGRAVNHFLINRMAVRGERANRRRFSCEGLGDVPKGRVTFPALRTIRNVRVLRLHADGSRATAGAPNMGGGGV